MTNPRMVNLDPSAREETLDLIRASCFNLPSRPEEVQYERDKRWLSDHRQELLADYEETWVAVQNEQVIQSHRNLDQLVEALQSDGVNLTTVVVDYLTTREFSMLL